MLHDVVRARKLALMMTMTMKNDGHGFSPLIYVNRRGT